MTKSPPYRARDSPAPCRRRENDGGFFVPIFTRRQSREPRRNAGNKTKNTNFGGLIMGFFNSMVNVLQMLVVALGAGLGIWGGINLLEGYGQDNPASKSQGMKQLMAGGGVAVIGLVLVPLLSGLFTV